MDDPNRPAPTATSDDLYALTTYDFPIIVRGTVKVLKLRHLDAFTRFIEDLIPMPLMAAASAILNRVSSAGDGYTGPEQDIKVGEAFASLDDNEKRELRELLWRNAVIVSVSPKLSLHGEDGTFPVKLLPMETLLRIYNENPPDAVVPAAPGGAAAAEFHPALGTAVADAGPDGAAVRATAEPLAPAGVSA